MVVLIDNSHAADPVQQICNEFGNQPDMLLEILHEVQKTLDYLSDSSLRSVAKALNISRAEIHGVVSFYHDYRREPSAALHIKMCRAEACQAVGSEGLAAYAEEKLGVSFGEKSADKNVALEAVYCLGNCALGPAVLIGNELFGRVSENRLDNLVAERLSQTGEG